MLRDVGDLGHLPQQLQELDAPQLDVARRRAAAARRSAAAARSCAMYCSMRDAAADGLLALQARERGLLLLVGEVEADRARHEQRAGDQREDQPAGTCGTGGRAAPQTGASAAVGTRGQGAFTGSPRSAIERARHDLGDVRRQARAPWRCAASAASISAAPRLGEALPQVERAGDRRGELRVRGVERQHLVRGERVAAPSRAWKRAKLRSANAPTSERTRLGLRALKRGCASSAFTRASVSGARLRRLEREPLVEHERLVAPPRLEAREQRVALGRRRRPSARPARRSCRSCCRRASNCATASARAARVVERAEVAQADVGEPARAGLRRASARTARAHACARVHALEAPRAARARARA